MKAYSKMALCTLDVSIYMESHFYLDTAVEGVLTCSHMIFSSSKGNNQTGIPDYFDMQHIKSAVFSLWKKFFVLKHSI